MIDSTAYSHDLLYQAEQDFAHQQNLPLPGHQRLTELRYAAGAHCPSVPFMQIGVWLVAPVLAGLIKWLDQQTADHQNFSLLGVMREGRFLGQLMTALTGRPVHELALNRHLALQAAFGCGDQEALLNWLVRTRFEPLTRAAATHQLIGNTVDDAAGDTELDLDAARQLITDWQSQNLWPLIQQRAANLCDRLLAHWQHIMTADARPQTTYALLDFASAANIQRALYKILQARQQSARLVGLNFLTTQGCRWAQQDGCDVRGYLADTGSPGWLALAYARTPEVIEIFTASTLGPLEDYTEIGQPVWGPSFLSPDHMTLLQQTQKQIMATAKVYYEALTYAELLALARCSWGRLLLQPLPTEAASLGDWPLDGGLDGRPRRQLAPVLTGNSDQWTKRQTAWPAASALRTQLANVASA